MPFVMGVSLSHDPSACIVDTDGVKVAIGEERLNRQKKSRLMLANLNGSLITKFLIPFRAINYCLDSLELGIDDLELIVIGAVFAPVHERTRDVFLNYVPVKDKAKVVALPHPSHHLSHAYSAFGCSGYDAANALVADCYGSDIPDMGNEAESGYLVSRQGWEQVFKNALNKDEHLGLGTMYRTITKIAGFVNPVNDQDDAGKTMALAAYGRDSFGLAEKMKVDGFHLDLDPVLDVLRELGLVKLVRQSGNRTEMHVAIRQRDKPITDMHRDLACGAQLCLERGMLHLAELLHSTTKCDSLCIAGGVGLNAVANRRLVNETPYKRFFVQPAATDDGCSVGCAYYGLQQVVGYVPSHSITNVFWGKTYDRIGVKSALEDRGLPIHELSTAELVRVTAQELARGKVVAWWQGKSEFGPRALGHRSILADPRHAATRDHINDAVKKRENFRPLAPSVLMEHCHEYFEPSIESPFMLLVAKVKSGKHADIPAVMHVDQTARLQTVSRENDELYYLLIKEFYELTGVPLILNTSFNIDGEPIVETPEDAISTFMSGRFDLLVIENFIVFGTIYSDHELVLKRPLLRSNVALMESEAKALVYRHTGAMFDKEDLELDLNSGQVAIAAASNGERTVAELSTELSARYPSLTKEALLADMRFLFMSGVIDLG